MRSWHLLAIPKKKLRPVWKNFLRILAWWQNNFDRRKSILDEGCPIILGFLPTNCGSKGDMKFMSVISSTMNMQRDLCKKVPFQGVFVVPNLLHWTKEQCKLKKHYERWKRKDGIVHIVTYAAKVQMRRIWWKVCETYSMFSFQFLKTLQRVKNDRCCGWNKK